MERPVQITYRGLEASEALNALIRGEVMRLERHFERIISCHVVVSREEGHHQRGAPYCVRIDLAIPGYELTIDTAKSLRLPPPDGERQTRRKRVEIDAAHKDPVLAVCDAFRTMRRRALDFARGRGGAHVRESIR